MADPVTLDGRTTVQGGSQPVTVMNAAASPIPVMATITLPAGIATEAQQIAGNASLTSIAAEDFATQTTLAAVLVQMLAANAMCPAIYDYVSCSYTGVNLTGVVFKTGGAGGVTVSTLTLTYDGSNNLLTVTKT